MTDKQFECYQYPWILSELQRAVSRVSHQVANTERIERRATARIGEYLKSGEGTYLNRKHITRLIYQETSFALKHSRREYAMHLADLTLDDGEGQAIEYDPEDVLADSNSGALELEETITLLAKDDRRNKMILNAWANGHTEAKEISCILADALGGNSESHRKHIQRFKKSCRTELTALAI